MKNKINRIFKVFILILPLLFLTSCDYIWEIIDILNQANSSFVAPDISEDQAAFYKPTTYKYTNRELGHNFGVAHLESIGEQKILVVPVVFTDYQQLATPALKSSIERAFFGQSSDTGWESVQSYYNKSSYGKLTLSGEVTDYFHLNISTTQLENMPLNDYYWDQTHYVLENLYNYLKTVDDGQLLHDYDLDEDGYVDALYLVYMAPYDYDSELFWAYMYYWNYYPNLTHPTFNSFAWSSYSFMEEGDGYSFAEVDAHTFIHETGHLLGLDDYYDYDSESNPSGSFDMMTYNVVDHTMYSKYLLNWSQPYVVNETTKITLRPAESSGDFIILNANWNNHVYDEYILIEYFTPTGLNYQDSVGYGYQNIRPFNENGVKIYHVDSRLIAITDGYYTYTDEIVSNETTYTDIGASNTAEYSVSDDFKLLHLLNAEGKSGDWYDNDLKPSNKALFKTGDEIAHTKWKTYLKSSSRFNSGKNINFSIQIGTMNDDGVDIYITKH
ncbi:MAG TPA: hypothetical protein VFD05_00610 [Bacilli bacterium]|nr:hypothetical protein [Bacilli bacterium]